MIILGGGGYTIRNVARCWAYETGCLLGIDMDDNLPINEYSEYFGPTHQLHIQTSNMENQNTAEYLQGVRSRILEHLSQIQPASGVSFHEVPSIHTGFTPDELDDFSPGQTVYGSLAHEAELEHEHDINTHAKHIGVIDSGEVTGLPRSTVLDNKTVTRFSEATFALPGHSISTFPQSNPASKEKQVTENPN
jgi:hypothetical protein